MPSYISRLTTVEAHELKGGDWLLVGPDAPPFPIPGPLFGALFAPENGAGKRSRKIPTSAGAAGRRGGGAREARQEASCCQARETLGGRLRQGRRPLPQGGEGERRREGLPGHGLRPALDPGARRQGGQASGGPRPRFQPIDPTREEVGLI